MRPLLERLGGFLPAAIALALPTVFIPIAIDSYILPRFAVVIAGSGLGFALALLVSRHATLGPLRLPLIAAGAAALLAFAFSVSWPESLVGSYTRYESVPIRLAYLGLLAAPAWLLADQRERERVIAAFVLGTSIASLQALWQEVLLLNHQIDYRPDGNLGNANLLGALLAMAIPLAIARGLRGGRFVVAWWLGLAVMAGALVATTSRSGGLGALAGCMALVVLRLRGKRALWGAAAGAAVIGLALLVILLSPLRLLNDDPGPSRLHLWPDAVHMIAARPLTGWGEDATGLVFGGFLSGNWAPEVDRAHSGPLDVGATQGLIGLAALGWVLVAWLRGVWRRRFTGSVGPLAAACVAYTVWVLFNFDWAPATGAFWLLAGTAWSGVRAADGHEATADTAVPAVGASRPVLPAFLPTFTPAVLAAVLAPAVVWFGVMPVLADVWYSQGRLDLAVVADPLQGKYHWALGQGLTALGSPARGLDEMLLAGRLGEGDPQLYIDIGDAERGLGRAADASAAYRTALRIDPYNLTARKRLAAVISVPASG
jgi:O-antigen ligase